MTGTWIADPTLSWTIALHARLSVAVDEQMLTARLRHTGVPAVVLANTGQPVLELVTASDEAPLRAATSGRELAIGAKHAVCDGLGLLSVLAHATATDVTSSARGVGDRAPRTTGRSAALERLREVLLAPPTIVAPDGGVSVPGDTFVRLTVPGRVGVAELTCAAVRAVRAYNSARGSDGSRIVVAIGASRVGGSVPVIGDHSALLRLRDLEGLSPAGVRDAIRSAAPEPPPPGATAPTTVSGRVTAATVTTGLRLLSRRLGSTLLVSHLGEVQAPGVEDLAFYPVTGGGSGISVGAVGTAGQTVITVRGRRHRHGPDALEALARRVRDELPS